MIDLDSGDEQGSSGPSGISRDTRKNGQIFPGYARDHLWKTMQFSGNRLSKIAGTQKVFFTFACEVWMHISLKQGISHVKSYGFDIELFVFFLTIF
jgi:hypothetical protein